MKEKYKKRLFIYIGILFCLISLVGVSYAVFNGYASQSSTNSLAATCVELVFSGENSVNLTNVYPISTSEGLKTTPYTFKIKNNCENYMQYTIIASVINTTNVLDSKFVRIALDGDDVLGPTNISVLKKINTPASLSGYSIKENFVLSETMGISKNEEKNFKFRMWLDGDSSETWTSEQVEGKNYQLKISVVATVKSKPADDLYIATLVDGAASSTFPTTSKYDASVSCENKDGTIDTGATITWSDSKWKLAIDDVSTGGTTCTVNFNTPKYELLADVIKGDNNANVSAAQTTPGTDISSSTEAVLASTADDYGTSYYYRGAITNNYVEYASMCWRIVRITGNGAIKMILYNYNGLYNSGTTPSSTTPCSETGTTLGYLRTTYSSTIFPINTTNTDNAHIGLMYGNFSTTNSSSYAIAHANNTKSNILTTLESWYTNTLAKASGFNESHLADTIWCNDKSTVKTTTFNPTGFSSINVNNYGIGKNYSYYAAGERLSSASSFVAGGSGPTLVCPNDNNGGKLSKYTVSDTTNGNGAFTYKIGMLTADEVAFAGGVFRKGNSTYYLYQNANDSSNNGMLGWWTISPFAFDGSTAGGGLIMVSHSGDMNYDRVDRDTWERIRPVISLNSSARVLEGNGTSSSPYKITFE
ncbi:MAG: hypothetical protein Q4C44_02665 [bacterium]|nr:hypothetical protein [bacterium]